MIEAMTTNKTSFFREQQHFDLPGPTDSAGLKNRRIRVWSAGCSSGEEPYSIAILLNETTQDLAPWDISILATDLRAGCSHAAAKVPMIQTTSGCATLTDIQYFTCIETNQCVPYKSLTITPPGSIRRLNLIEEWPMRGPFDVIFCRNVITILTNPLRHDWLTRFWKLLKLGGHLLSDILKA